MLRFFSYRETFPIRIWFAPKGCEEDIYWEVVVEGTVDEIALVVRSANELDGVVWVPRNDKTPFENRRCRYDRQGNMLPGSDSFPVDSPFSHRIILTTKNPDLEMLLKLYGAKEVKDRKTGHTFYPDGDRS